VLLTNVDDNFNNELATGYKKTGDSPISRVDVEGTDYRGRPWRCRDRRDHELHQHLQPVGAGRRRPRRAQGARARPHRPSPGSRPALSPGSQVVTDYLNKSKLTEDLDAMGFNLVGYGCTSCIGNSGPLPGPISKAINEHDLVAASVLSGNRNFEGRVSPDVRANFLASPPLVVAYALKGTVRDDHHHHPDRHSTESGKPVFSRTSGRPTRKSPTCRFGDRSRHVSHPLRQRVRGRSQVARHHDRGVEHLSLEPGLDLRPEPALFRGHVDDAAAGAGHSSMRNCSRSSAIRSPPITSRRPARSRSIRRRVVIWASIRSRRATSTAMARAAATMK
jgi:hypothetical protein